MPALPFWQKTHHGSFLQRSKDTLAKIAEMTKPVGTAVGGVKNSGKFVFSAVSPDEKEDQKPQVCVAQIFVSFLYATTMSCARHYGGGVCPCTVHDCSGFALAASAAVSLIAMCKSAIPWPWPTFQGHNTRHNNVELNKSSQCFNLQLSKLNIYSSYTSYLKSNSCDLVQILPSDFCLFLHQLFYNKSQVFIIMLQRKRHLTLLCSCSMCSSVCFMSSTSLLKFCSNMNSAGLFAWERIPSC